MYFHGEDLSGFQLSGAPRGGASGGVRVAGGGGLPGGLEAARRTVRLCGEARTSGAGAVLHRGSRAGVGRLCETGGAVSPVGARGRRRLSKGRKTSRERA
jgi:hypothetical protein